MAFSDTVVIDSGVGADENPLAGPWSTVASLVGIQRTSNTFFRGAAFSGSYRPADIAPASCEFYLRIASVPGTGEQSYLLARITTAGASSVSGVGFNGYSVLYGKDGSGVFWVEGGVWTDGSHSSLPSGLFAGTWTIGDYVGIRCAGNQITNIYIPVGTGIPSERTDTDSTYNTIGVPCFALSAASTVHVDNFRGILTSPTILPSDNPPIGIAGRGAGW